MNYAVAAILDLRSQSVAGHVDDQVSWLHFSGWETDVSINAVVILINEGDII